MPDVIMKNATTVSGTILINHSVQLLCAVRCPCAAWGLWDCQVGKEAWFGTARPFFGFLMPLLFVLMQLSHALTDPLKIKASLLLFQLLMDWNNMNEHEVPSSLLTLHPLGARQELRCVTCYCINNAVLLLMFNIPQYEGRKVGQM